MASGDEKSRDEKSSSSSKITSSKNTSSKSFSEKTTERTVVVDRGSEKNVDTKPVLVVQTAFLGDAVLSVPLLKRIRLKKPNAKIHLVLRKGLGQFVKELGLADFCYEIEKGSSRSYSLASERLGEIEFDWLVCPHESFRTALFVRGINANVKMGYEHWWNSFFFTERVEREWSWPEPLRQMQLLKSVDLEITQMMRSVHMEKLNSPDEFGLLPPPPPWASLSCQEKILSWPDPFGLDQPYVCIFPGSVWATKRWVDAGFADLARSLIVDGFQVCWLGGADEVELCKSLEARVPGTKSFAGKASITHSLSLIARAEAVVSNDSGGQHLGALAGVPVLSIFGPTTPEMGFRSWANHTAIVERRGLSCRPCGKHGHQKCPISTHDCMRGISASFVRQTLDHLIRQTP